MQRTKTAAAVGDLHLRTRTALLGLEDKDLAAQAQLGVQRLIRDLQATWEIENVLRDILANLDQCSAHARRLRYKYGVHLKKSVFEAHMNVQWYKRWRVRSVCWPAGWQPSLSKIMAILRGSWASS